MPTIKVPKQSLEGPVAIPPGIYKLRFDGFEPKPSKSGDSINLNPILKIINNPDLHDRRIYLNLNNKAGWIVRDFVHGLGCTLMGSDGDEIPGDFGPEGESDVTKLKYSGPLLGQTCDVELAQVDKYMNIKRFICAVPGCTEKHSENLL